MRLPVLLLALAACNNPLSNDVFYADDAFLDALPDADRIGFSSALTRYPRGGVDPVLGAMAIEAEHLNPSITLVIGVTNVLSNSSPDERGDTFRHWAARAVSTPSGAERELYFMRADIAQSTPDSDFTWQIEGAVEEDGPWQVLGSGRHDPDGSGVFTWDLSMTSELVGADPIGTLDATYDGRDDSRVTEFDIRANLVTTRTYSFVGGNQFTWVGEVQLGDEPVEGAGRVFVQADGAGRGLLTVYPDGTEQLQEGCWGINGETQFANGTLIGASGDPASCSVGNPF